MYGLTLLVSSTDSSIHGVIETNSLIDLGKGLGAYLVARMDLPNIIICSPVLESQYSVEIHLHDRLLTLSKPST